MARKLSDRHAVLREPDGARVRARTEDDLTSCERLARFVHQRDGYPPRFADDLHAFVATPGAIATWVAENNDTIVGHVALHPQGSDEVMMLAARVARRPPERLAVVFRLLVSPDVRRTGVGKALLEAAANSAIDRGLRPVLDVATHFHNAIRPYERCGWTRVGEVTVRCDVGEPLDEYVYISPERGAEPGDPT